MTLFVYLFIPWLQILALGTYLLNDFMMPLRSWLTVTAHLLCRAGMYCFI